VNLFRNPKSVLVGLIVGSLRLWQCSGAGLNGEGASNSTDALYRRIKVLSSDSFEGRAPGTEGEHRTVQWLKDQFQSMGLAPGAVDGSYIDPVPMIGVTSETKSELIQGAHRETLIFPQDIVAWSPRADPVVSVPSSDLVFAGYGAAAPEYGWDDFKGVDLRGKILVMLIGDPPIPDPQDPSKLDERMFKGKAMTYYGRWTYKYEIAASRGALGAILVHETGPAGYPWPVVVNSWGRERFDLAEGGGQNLAVAGWIPVERARKLFADSGVPFEEAKRRALRADFRPMPLGISAQFSITNRIRHLQSQNVAAQITGSDPKLRDEWLIFTAHWDHLGKNPALQGDQIFNGASDNATGTAGLLCLAEAFAHESRPNKRSILFLALTGEEQGLLGAKHYVTHPSHPLKKTLADINMDGLNVFGRTHDIGIVGVGNTTLEELLEHSARRHGRRIFPDPKPELGRFYRSDHFEFAKVGVPSLYTTAGMDFVGKPSDWGEIRATEYREHDYHKVSDEIKPDWDLSGAVEDLQLLFEVGRDVANTRKWPEWKAGSEFKELRERQLHRHP